MPKIEYSDDLSVNTWKTHQTALGKLTQKKSGMSEALRDLEAAFGDVDQRQFDLDIVGDVARTSAELTQVMTTSVDHYNKTVVALQKQAKVVRDLADDLHDQYTKSKVAPAKTAAQLKAISTAADQLLDDFGDKFFTTWVERFKSRIARFVKSEEANRAEFLKVTKSFPQDIAQVKMVLGDIEDFADAQKVLLKFWQEGVRSLAAVLNVCGIQELKDKHIRLWSALNSDVAVRVKSIEEIKEYVEKVEKAFALLQRDLPK